MRAPTYDNLEIVSLDASMPPIPVLMYLLLLINVNNSCLMEEHVCGGSLDFTSPLPGEGEIFVAHRHLSIRELHGSWTIQVDPDRHRNFNHRKKKRAYFAFILIQTNFLHTPMNTSMKIPKRTYLIHCLTEVFLG